MQYRTIMRLRLIVLFILFAVSTAREWFHRDDRHHYLYVETEMSWANSERFCLDRSGHLLSINDQEEYDFIFTQAHARGILDEFWIGLSRNCASCMWEWSSNDMVDELLFNNSTLTAAADNDEFYIFAHINEDESSWAFNTGRRGRQRNSMCEIMDSCDPFTTCSIYSSCSTDASNLCPCFDELCSPQCDPCQHGGTCTEDIDQYTYGCSCDSGYTGENCESDINECTTTAPCVNGGCVNEDGSYRCDCNPGYMGHNCETDINECIDDPCVNGRCMNAVGSYTCDCISGYTGQICDTDFDECTSNPCAYGDCRDGINGYSCFCSQGFAGVNCESNIDECHPLPCGTYGTCIDKVHAYMCVCVNGFTGSSCDVDIDECEDSIDCGGGECDNTLGGFECRCHKGYEGTRCEFKYKSKDTTGDHSETITSGLVTAFVVLVVTVGITAVVLLLIKRRRDRATNTDTETSNVHNKHRIVASFSNLFKKRKTKEPNNIPLEGDDNDIYQNQIMVQFSVREPNNVSKKFTGEAQAPGNAYEIGAHNTDATQSNDDLQANNQRRPETDATPEDVSLYENVVKGGNKSAQKPKPLPKPDTQKPPYDKSSHDIGVSPILEAMPDSPGYVNTTKQDIGRENTSQAYSHLKHTNVPDPGSQEYTVIQTRKIKPIPPKKTFYKH